MNLKFSGYLTIIKTIGKLLLSYARKWLDSTNLAVWQCRVAISHRDGLDHSRVRITLMAEYLNVTNRAGCWHYLSQKVERLPDPTTIITIGDEFCFVSK
jgi:hypothetical protein